MTIERRIEEIERDIERLYERTKDIPVMIERVENLTRSVDALRAENRAQHAEGKSEIKQVRAWLVTGALAMAGTFGAGLIAVISQGGGG